MDYVQELTVSMYWDGETSPSVWAPLGDFFGTSCGDKYSALPLGYLEDGWFYCYFRMPYKNGAKIVIGNDGTQVKNILVNIGSASLSAPIDNYTRFHAKWNMNAQQVEQSDRSPDYTVLNTQGKGRFVGLCLHVFEKGDYGWWGRR